jgi:putative membrane protein
MGTKQVEGRKRSILKGALAGLVGGIVGSGAKAVAEKLYPPRIAGETPPPVVLAEYLEGHPLTDGQRQIALQGIHWTFGALAGAVYGAAVELEPKAGVWRGAGFGLALNKLTHGGLLPQAGLSKPTDKQTIQEKQSEWFSHAVYGFSTDLVRRIVRKGL